MVERRPPQAPPASKDHEETVAIPVNRPASSNGSGKVLPPMPKDKPTSAPSGRSATPPPPPPSSRPTAKPAQQPTAKPAPKSPPAQAPRSAPTPAAGTPAPTSPSAASAPAKAPQKRPAVSPMPVVPEVDKRAERRAARDAKSAEQAAAKEAARKAREAKAAKAPAKAQVAETKGPKSSRRARLRMTRIDPWSVMKTAFLLSIALGIVIVVSVFMVWSVLDAADVWSSINQTVRDVTGEGSSFDIEDYLGTRRIVGFAMIVAAVDVVLLTAIATLGAFLYNMSASLLGGIEVTLAEDK
jgi:Transmembrane domain of unknown function (DUF3566)